MSARHARLRLRYRPASDVLSGEIELGTLAADHRIVESPDADTHIEWQPGLELDGLMLSAFQVVHASALVEGETLRRLPAEVVTLSRQLVRTGRGALRAGATAIEQVQARAEADAHLTAEQLLRPATAPELTTRRPTRRPSSRATSAVPPDLASTDHLAALSLPALDDEPSLHRPLDDSLANDSEAAGTALEQVASAIARLGDDDLHRGEHLVQLLRELAAVLRDEPGTTSPGTSAAARRAARGGLALSNSERSRLRWALRSLDTPDTWDAAITELGALADQLGGQPGARTRGRSADISGAPRRVASTRSTPPTSRAPRRRAAPPPSPPTPPDGGSE